MLISDNLRERKNYFDSNIVWNENVRILRRFSKDYIAADVDRSTRVYVRRHQGAKSKHFDVSEVIYHRLPHGAASYTLNGENLTYVRILYKMY